MWYLGGEYNTVQEACQPGFDGKGDGVGVMGLGGYEGEGMGRV